MERVFLSFSIRKLRQLEQRIQECLGRLSEEQAWTRLGPEQNAIGNLVLHLSGNVRQWLGMGVFGEPDNRQRDAEFAARGSATIVELQRLLHQVVANYTTQLEGMDGAQLRETTQVQHYKLTKLEAIYHVVEHFAEHTGQILLLTKALTAKDLGFYRHLRDGQHGEQTP